MRRPTLIRTAAAGSSNEQVPPLADLEDFVHDHRSHDTITGDATDPAWNGNLLTVACPCGVVFGRWVTPLEAEVDLMRAAGLN